MPNIEIHGFSQSDVKRAEEVGSPFEGRNAGEQRAELLKLVRWILFEEVVDALKGAPYAKDAAITTAADDVRTLENEFDPFIRIVAEKAFLDEYLEDLERRLTPLNRGIEVMPIQKYIPPKK